MKYKLKLITGFRRDQEYSIDANEAHKAYYLFEHPEARTTFRDGLAIKGDQIQEVVPDYQRTMGWNPTHVLDGDDYNEIARAGVDRKMQMIMSAAREIAKFAPPAELNTPLSELLRTKYPQLKNPNGERTGGIKRITPPSAS